jgi:hypothetical protein
VEFIGIGKCMKEHTYNTYIVKSNLGSKESWVIQSNQDVRVCGVMYIYIYGSYPNSTMLLENISHLKLGNNCKKTWAILFIFFSLLFFFFKRASKYPLF